MVSRRLFMRRAAAGSVAGWVLWRMRPGEAAFATVTADHQGAFFNEGELRLLSAVVALIVPADGSLGAVEAGAVDKIVLRVRESRELQALYRTGLRQLDDLSTRDFGRAFLLLEPAQREQVLTRSESTEFFRTLCNHTVHAYYASPIGWQAAGYPGPAQFHGYRDYDKPPR